MRRVNLLPPEDRGQSLAGVPGNVTGIFLIAAASIIAIVAVFSLICLLRLNALDNEIADIDAEIAVQNQRLAELQPYATLESEVAAKQPVADGVVRTRFPWSEFLRGLAFVVPDTTQLETLTAEASPVDITAPLGQTLQPPGSVTFTGFAEADNTNLADFVLRIDTLRFLANSQLNLAELDRETFSTPALNFEVGSELITEVGASESELPLEDADDPAAAQSSAAAEQYSGGDPTGVASATETQYAEERRRTVQP